MAAAPLTQATWGKRKDRGSWSYSQYRNWWDRIHKPAAAATIPTGLQPIGYPQLQQTADEYVRSQTQPLISNITNDINARSAAGTKQIQGVYEQFAKEMAGAHDQVAQDYGAGIGKQSALWGGLANLIQGDANTQAADIGAQLTAAGAPQASLDAFSKGLAALGHGAATSTLASGTADASALTAEGAREATYASNLPNYARGMGIQGVNQLQALLETERGQRVGDITAQVPGMTKEILNSLLDRELQKQIAVKGFNLDQKKLDASITNATTAYDYKTAKTTATLHAKAAAAAAKGYQKTLDSATKMAHDLYARKGVGGTAQPAANVRAYQQVYSYITAAHPNWTPAQSWAVAQAALRSGGYLKVPAANPFGPQPKTQGAGGQAPAPARPTAPGGVKGGERTQSNATTAATKPKPKPKSAVQDAANLNRKAAADADYVARAVGRSDTQVMTQIMALLAKQYPGIPLETRRAIARSAVARRKK